MREGGGPGGRQERDGEALERRRRARLEWARGVAAKKRRGEERQDKERAWAALERSRAAVIAASLPDRPVLRERRQEKKL